MENLIEFCKKESRASKSALETKHSFGDIFMTLLKVSFFLFSVLISTVALSNQSIFLTSRVLVCAKSDVAEVCISATAIPQEYIVSIFNDGVRIYPPFAATLEFETRCLPCKGNIDPRYCVFGVVNTSKFTGYEHSIQFISTSSKWPDNTGIVNGIGLMGTLKIDNDIIWSNFERIDD